MDLRMQSGRTAPRQAIIALYEQSDRWPNVSLALALDLVAVMSAANGFSLALGCAAANDATVISRRLPAGVDVRIPPPGAAEGPAISFTRLYAEQGYERIIVVVADTIGVSTRVLSTASSILAAAPLVVGETPSDGLYAVGARGRDVLAGNHESLAALTVLTSTGNAPSAAVRRLEPLPRLRDAASLDQLRSLIEAAGQLVPRAIDAMSAVT